MMISKSRHRLAGGSRVAVIGGGPAGSFFSYFFLDLARRRGHRVELRLHVCAGKRFVQLS